MNGSEDETHLAADEARLAAESALTAAGVFVALFESILSGAVLVDSLSVLTAYISGAGAGIDPGEIPLWLVGQGYSEADALAAAEFYARVEAVASFEQISTILAVAQSDPGLLTPEQWERLYAILAITADQFGTESLDRAHKASHAPLLTSRRQWSGRATPSSGSAMNQATGPRNR